MKFQLLKRPNSSRIKAILPSGHLPVRMKSEELQVIKMASCISDHTIIIFMLSKRQMENLSGNMRRMAALSANRQFMTIKSISVQPINTFTLSPAGMGKKSGCSRPMEQFTPRRRLRKDTSSLVPMMNIST